MHSNGWQLFDDKWTYRYQSPFIFFALPNGTAQPGTNTFRQMTHESCKDNWDYSFQWGSIATGDNQYLKFLSAEQTYLATTLARSIFLHGTSCCECFGYPNTYMESQPCNLQLPCHMQLDKNRAEISAHAHCSWNLPSIHSSALNSSFLLACFVLVLALPCPSSELSQIDKPAENQYN